jgi:hypothetical protein
MLKGTRRGVGVAALASLVLWVAACGGGGDEGSLTVELAEQSGSGESGKATLTPSGLEKTRVVIELVNPPNVPQPAHIHPGTCQQLDPKPAYALTNVVDGKGETTIPAPLAELRQADLVINVHKSEAEIATYAACGAIS